MAAVADLERLLERVFERTTARLFRAGVQVVQLEHRVERAMERARTPDGARIAVPARYRVRLHPSDLADVASRAGGAEAVAVRLAENALTFARAHGYHLVGRPEVWLVADPLIERGQVEVEAVPKGTPTRVPSFAPAAPASAAPAPAALAPAPEPHVGAVSEAEPAVARTPAPGVQSVARTHAPAAPPAAAAGAPVVMPVVEPVAAPVPAPVGAMAAEPVPAASPSPLTPAGAPGAVATGLRGDGAQAPVFRRPAPQPARAILRVSARDGRERTIEVDGTPLTIGRSHDNVLVIEDARVSRHHGRFQARRGTLVYTDLGSTNGSRVNGIRVDEIVLGEGDRLQVGDTVMVVETLPG